MRKTLTLTADLRYRIAFVRHCADRAVADPVGVAKAQAELADAVLAAVERPTRRQLAELSSVTLQPVQAVIELALRPKRRRA